MCNDEIECNEIYFSIEIDVFDKKEKMNGYVSIPQIEDEAMENDSEWYTWTNNGYVNRIEYPSIEFGHKYMEWIDLITEIIFMYEIGDGLTVIQRKDIKISVSNNPDDL